MSDTNSDMSIARSLASLATYYSLTGHLPYVEALNAAVQNLIEKEYRVVTEKKELASFPDIRSDTLQIALMKEHRRVIVEVEVKVREVVRQRSRPSSFRAVSGM
jgi:hypothetical protein